MNALIRLQMYTPDASILYQVLALDTCWLGDVHSQLVKYPLLASCIIYVAPQYTRSASLPYTSGIVYANSWQSTDEMQSTQFRLRNQEEGVPYCTHVFSSISLAFFPVSVVLI